jgi:hypothetical protein
MELNRKRSVYSGTSLLANLKSHAGSGQYKNFQMTPADFKLLINLMGQKIVKVCTRFRVAVTVQEIQAVTL